MPPSRFFTWSIRTLIAALPLVVSAPAFAEEDAPEAEAPVAVAAEDGDASEEAPKKVDKPVSKHKAKPAAKKKNKASAKSGKSKVASKKKASTKDKKIASKGKAGSKPKKDSAHKDSHKIAKAEPKKDKGHVMLQKGVKNDAPKADEGSPKDKAQQKKKPRRPLKRRMKDASEEPGE